MLLIGRFKSILAYPRVFKKRKVGSRVFFSILKNIMLRFEQLMCRYFFRRKICFFSVFSISKNELFFHNFYFIVGVQFTIYVLHSIRFQTFFLQAFEIENSVSYWYTFYGMTDQFL